MLIKVLISPYIQINQKLVLFLRKSTFSLSKMNVPPQIKRAFPYLALLIIAGMAFFQVVFFQHPMVYDTIDCFYPWRFHVGECFQNGIFPFWNPYQDLGYPSHADPSSGTWYPMVWLIGSTIGYNLYTIALEFFVHIFFAGVGMFTLAKTLRFDWRIAFIAAVSYMLCGVFVGNAQHLPYVISAAWLPFLLNFYFRMIREHSWSNAYYAGFFLFLMITGGYAAFVIILFYFFVITAGIYLFRAAKFRGAFAFSDLIARHTAFVLTAIIFSAGQLYSIWQVSPYLDRIQGFTLEQALFSPFGPKAFISFVFPFATVRFSEWFNSDISMINGYFGIILFIFFIAGLFSKKSIEVKFLLGLGLFSLAAAVGDALPFREILYRYVPLMNVFRFPSVFRIFTVLSFILIGANYLNNQYRSGQTLNFKRWIIPLTGILSFFIVIVFWLRAKTDLGILQFIDSAILKAVNDSKIEQHIVFQAILQFSVILLLLVIVKFVKKRDWQIRSIAVLITLDLIFATQLNAPYTVYYPQVDSGPAFSATNDLPKGFPAMNDISIEEAGKLPGLGSPYWQNLNIFQKQISAEGFNSFSFGSYEDIERKYPFVFKELQKNRVVLLSDKVIHARRMVAANRDSTFKPNYLFFEDAAFNVLNTIRLKNIDSDDAYITSYSPNKFKIKTLVEETQLLTLFQKDYIGWKAYIDGEETPIYKSNYNFMTIVVPGGTQEVVFEYENPIILGAFGISVFSCLLLLIHFLNKVFRD